MASSNPNNTKDTKSHAYENNYNSDDATFVDPKHEPKPNSQHGVHDEQADSKVDAALRFLKSVFEDGDSNPNKGGHFHMFRLINLNTYVFCY